MKPAIAAPASGCRRSACPWRRTLDGITEMLRLARPIDWRVRSDRICRYRRPQPIANAAAIAGNQSLNVTPAARSEEHTSELQSQSNLVCRLLLEKKKNNTPAG